MEEMIPYIFVGKCIVFFSVSVSFCVVQYIFSLQFPLHYLQMYMEMLLRMETLSLDIYPPGTVLGHIVAFTKAS